MISTATLPPGEKIRHFSTAEANGDNIGMIPKYHMFSMLRLKDRCSRPDELNGYRKFLLAIELFLIANLVCYMGNLHMACADPKRNSELKPDVRTLKFPAEHSLGSVSVIPLRTKRWDLKYQVATAKDSVTVTVPPNDIVLLSGNQYAALHPALLNEVSREGIDALKISFMSMDEREDGICDKALPYASHFSDAIRLDVSASDASDAGVDSIPPMPKLECLWLYRSSVRGSCLKRIGRFSKLREIDLSDCAPFHEDDLKYLAKVHDLVRLELANCLLSKKGVSIATECKNLTFLNLSQNKCVDDSCLPLLLSLKNLHELWLKQTPVTASGLMVLTALNLKAMTLSKSHFTVKEKAMLQERFPHVKFDYSGDKLRGDSRVLLSPILGH